MNKKRFFDLLILMVILLAVSSSVYSSDGENRPASSKYKSILDGSLQRAYSSDRKICAAGPDVFSTVQIVREAESLRNKLSEWLPLNKNSGLPLKINLFRDEKEGVWRLKFLHKKRAWNTKSSGTPENNSYAVAKGVLVMALTDVYSENDKDLPPISMLPDGVVEGFIVLLSRSSLSVREIIKEQHENDVSQDGGSIVALLFNTQKPDESDENEKFSGKAAFELQKILNRKQGQDVFLNALGTFYIDRDASDQSLEQLEEYIDSDEAGSNDKTDKNRLLVTAENLKLSSEDTLFELKEISASIQDIVKESKISKIYPTSEIAEQKVNLLNLKMRASAEFSELISEYLDVLNSGLEGKWGIFNRRFDKAEKKLRGYDE